MLPGPGCGLPRGRVWAKRAPNPRGPASGSKLARGLGPPGFRGIAESLKPRLRTPWCTFFKLNTVPTAYGLEVSVYKGRSRRFGDSGLTPSWHLFGAIPRLSVLALSP